MSSFKGRGAFILFEGMDRCGKSTQVQLLRQHLQAASSSSAVEDIRFPNRDSHVGQLINSYLSSASNLNDQAIHLLFSANRWEQASDIRDKLSAGTTLVGAVCMCMCMCLPVSMRMSYASLSLLGTAAM
jgi:dTMP kinase